MNERQIEIQGEIIALVIAKLKDYRIYDADFIQLINDKFEEMENNQIK